MPSRSSSISVSAPCGQPRPGSAASSAAKPEDSAEGSGAQSLPRQIAGCASRVDKVVGAVVIVRAIDQNPGAGCQRWKGTPWSSWQRHPRPLSDCVISSALPPSARTLATAAWMSSTR